MLYFVSFMSNAHVDWMIYDTFVIFFFLLVRVLERVILDGAINYHKIKWNFVN